MTLYKILLNYQYIIFDCDGVILNSNEIKTNGFKKLFQNHPNYLIDKIVNYHKNNGGKSRYMKIKYFYENLLKKKISEKDLISQATKYGKITLNDLKESDFIPGLLKLLKLLKKNNKSLYVVSGSDEKDLIKILKYKKIDSFFKKIKGSPKDKIENLKNILPLASKRKKSVYIGDSEYDYNSSSAIGLNFIYISGYSEWKVEKSFLRTNEITFFENFAIH